MSVLLMMSSFLYVYTITYRMPILATETCATNGGADRPTEGADVSKAGTPARSKYGTGHTPERAPSAISPDFI
ncbi:MAG TPA: hypothetical protein VFS97_02925 [Nitrososphaeraceae archaeon]|nr:hypothetical protein [Nitrososphaeraceae archaeon]